MVRLRLRAVALALVAVLLAPSVAAGLLPTGSPALTLDAPPLPAGVGRLGEPPALPSVDVADGIGQGSTTLVIPAENGGAPTVLQVPFPTILMGPDGPGVLRVTPTAAGRRIDPRLLDPVYLAAEGGVEQDGTLRVILRGDIDDSPLLKEARRFAPLRLTAATIALADLPAVALLPGVERVFPNGEVRALLTESVPLIRAPEVHAQQDANGSPVLGTGIKVAVIDTGVDYTHPDLGGCLGTSCKVYSGYDYVDADPDPMDGNGHGTHVAATAAGVNGVAPGARIAALRVLDNEGRGSYEGIMAAILDSVSHEVDVISLSLGGPGTADGPVSAAVDYAVSSGVVVVSAAGNAGPGADTIGEPAASLLGITVGASDDLDRVATFSSRGPVYFANGSIAGVKPDILAPGVGIVAAVPTGECELCNASGYRALRGTSMATPHVSGVAALLLQANPDWTPSDVKAALLGSVVPLDLDSRTGGLGRVDAFAAWSATVGILPGNGFLGFVTPGAGVAETTLHLEVRNLRAAPRNVTLTAETGHLGLAFSESALTLGPREARAVSLLSTLNRSAAPDRWLEANLTVADPEGNPAAAKVSLLKQALLRVTLDAPADALMIYRNDRGVASIIYPDEAIELRVERGTFSAVAMGRGCPPSVPLCGPADGLVAVTENVTNDGEATLALRFADATHPLTTRNPFRDGTFLDPATTTSCFDGGNAPRCIENAGIRVVPEGTDAWLFAGSGAGTTYFPTLSPRWHLAPLTVYRDGADLYTVGNATQGITGPVTFSPDPQAFTEHVVRYALPEPYLEGVRIQACAAEKISLGGVKNILPFETERMLLSLPPVEATLPVADGALSVSPCIGLFQILLGGPHELGIFCAEHESGCAMLGISNFQRVTPEGVRQFASYVDTVPLDERGTRDEGALLILSGAARFSGEVTAGNGSLEIRSPAFPGLFFEPASGGFQLTPQLTRSPATFRLIENDTETRQGYLAALTGPIPLSGDGPVTLEAHYTGSPVGRRMGNATATLTYDSIPSGTRLPSTAYARVLGDDDLGSPHPAGAARRLLLSLDNPQETGFGSVSVAVRKAGVLAAAAAPVLVDGIYRVDLPDLGEGAYDLFIEATTPEGVTVRLAQEPAFEVGPEVPVNRRPTVRIESLDASEVLSLPFQVTGSASDPDGNLTLAAVEIRVNEGPWMTANGTSSWSVTLDETSVPGDGYHLIEARASDGSAVSRVTSGVAAVCTCPRPTVTITDPVEGAVLMGSIVVRGTKHTEREGTFRVGLEVDFGEGWTEVFGFDDWALHLDTNYLPDGPLAIRARAYDDDGFLLYSDVATVNVTIRNGPPPVVAIASPADGTLIRGPTLIEGTAYHQNESRQVYDVFLEVDGTWMGSATGTSAWSYALDPEQLPEGPITVRAIASDGYRYAFSTPITLHVEHNDAPSVAFTDPASGATVAGTLLLKGTASDPDGNATLDRVEVRVADGPWLLANGTAAWAREVDLSTLANGPLLLEARAVDDLGLEAVTSVEVTLANNALPEATILTPEQGGRFIGRVVLTGTATDADGDGTLQHVEVLVPGGEWEPASGTTEWRFEHLPSPEYLGNQTYLVRAFDGEGYGPAASVALFVDPRPDLRVLDLRVEEEPAPVEPLSDILRSTVRRVRATVVNEGATAATDFLVVARIAREDAFVFGAPLPLGERALGETRVASLAPGESVALTWTWDTTGDLGAYEVSVQVDGAGSVEEANESNNAAFTRAHVIVTGEELP